MGLSRYLAITAAELEKCSHLPEKLAYMALHFSSYGTGLSNEPSNLPEDSILILNDRTPVANHDPTTISTQLEILCDEYHPSALLLDLQRPSDMQTQNIIEQILKIVPCKCIISDLYAKSFDCPVFLSAPPIYVPLKEYIIPWQDREIWLEAALDGCSCKITEDSNQITVSCLDDLPLYCKELHCHYDITTGENISIYLSRNRQDLNDFLEEGETLGIAGAIGLYQQLQNI